MEKTPRVGTAKPDLVPQQPACATERALLEDARVLYEAKRRYNAMVALHQASLDVISQLDIHELLDSLLGRGVELVGAQSGTISLYDSELGLIQRIASHNMWRDRTGVVVRPGEGVIGHVFVTGKPVIVNDYNGWPHRAEAFVGNPMSAKMGAPLTWRDRVIGGVVVFSDPKIRRFDEDDLWLLCQFADLAAIAIQNAQLHTQVRESSRELERRVDERTRELAKAKEDLSAKAQQLGSLLTKTVHIQEKERARIAHDMHDGVIQLVTATRYEVKAAKVALGSSQPGVAVQKLDATGEVLDELEREIRRAIYDLHPPTLDAVGLIPALRRHAFYVSDLCGVLITVKVTGDVRRLPVPTEIAVFRLVEEALNNVATHAGAGNASVEVSFRPTMVHVTIEDDGRGFDAKRRKEIPDGSHLGLVGMKERAATLGGKIEVASSPGSGTQITFRLPAA